MERQTKRLDEKSAAADVIFWHLLVHHTQRMS